ncbi:MAG: (2Fe-2S)-binding protein [Betaproteobacteria bacterium RBG_16_64_18]|nr:MAG: (2Fe-2S)-binding protein [Betaproteobacteria bacterium RBG_16_64_18]
MKRTVRFTLNGEQVLAEIEPWSTLLSVLRDNFRLTGAKEGCGYGECGTCTVLMDGLAINACMMLALQAEAKDVVTIEGLASRDGELHSLQKAFIQDGAIQCGFCTPGMILSAKALLDQDGDPTEEEIKKAIVGNLCRCTGYAKIIEAIKSASGK